MPSTSTFTSQRQWVEEERRKELEKQGRKDEAKRRKEEKQRKELEKRARKSPVVHLQMVERDEKDDNDLRSIFEEHLKKKYKNKWAQFSDEEKEEKIDQILIKNRIPWTPRGGKRKTRRHKSKKIVRKTNKRKSKKSKRKGRKTRRK